MRKTIISFCALLIVPLLCNADSFQENRNGNGNDQYENYPTDSTGSAEGSRKDWEEEEIAYSRRSSSLTKNPESRSAYLRGEEEYQRHLKENRPNSGRYVNENQRYPYSDRL